MEYILNEEEKKIINNYFSNKRSEKRNSKVEINRLINKFLNFSNYNDIIFKWDSNKTLLNHIISNCPNYHSKSKIKLINNFNPDWCEVDDDGNNVFILASKNNSKNAWFLLTNEDKNFFIKNQVNGVNKFNETYHIILIKSMIKDYKKNFNNSNIIIQEKLIDICKIFDVCVDFFKNNIYNVVSDKNKNDLLIEMKVLMKYVEYFDNASLINFYIKDLKDNLSKYISFVELNNIIDIKKQYKKIKI